MNRYCYFSFREETSLDPSSFIFKSDTNLNKAEHAITTKFYPRGVIVVYKEISKAKEELLNNIFGKKERYLNG